MAQWDLLPDAIQCKIFNSLDTWDRWPLILVCKAWKNIIADPMNQPDSIIFLPEHMHISCLRALCGNVKSLELERDYYNDVGEIDQFVLYNCILTRAATLGVQHLNMSLAPPGHWALSMFQWGGLLTVLINFVGVHQLEEFADSFSGLSRLKDLHLCVSYITYKGWNGEQENDGEMMGWSHYHEPDESECIHRASRCYAECIMPALEDIEQLCLRPLLQPEFELLLQHLPNYHKLRALGIQGMVYLSQTHYNSLKIPVSLSPNLGKLAVLRWPDADKLEGLGSGFDSLEELYVGDKTFEANILKDFKCLEHVYVELKACFDKVSAWLNSHSPHITCHLVRPRGWTDF